MNDKDLDQLLKDARTSVPTPLGFHRDVWHLIETTERGGWAARIWQIVDRSLGYLAMPRMAIATCTAVALAGAWIGTKTAVPSRTHEVSYVQSISPFSNSHH